MTEYLPGTAGNRITDLRESAGLTIEELAVKVNVNATTLGRIENGQTKKVSNDVLIALAREFGVSTDFLLGLTNIPDRKNYDISELGLSAQAARNLYTRKVNPDVVNLLLEHPRFVALTAMISQYLDDSLAAGFAAQNQLFSSLTDVLCGIGREGTERRVAAAETAHTINLVKVPPHQVELSKIQNTFMTMLKEIKRDTASNWEPAKAATKDVVEKMMAELAKGQDKPLVFITPEQITDAIVHTVDDGTLDPEKLVEFRAGVNALFESLSKVNAVHDQ